MANTQEQQIVWEPQAGPQTYLVTCPVEEIFYGGARGGGKTEASIGEWLQHSLKYGQKASGIFVRRKLIQLSDVIKRTRELYPKLGALWNEQRKTWTMANGATLRFVYLENDSDAEEYQGHSYTRVYIEEATNFPSISPIAKLKATLRSGAGIPTAMILTGNPGGAGHNWVKARYIDPFPAGMKVLTEHFLEIMDEAPKSVVMPDGGIKRTNLFGVHPVIRFEDTFPIIQSGKDLVLKVVENGVSALVKESRRVFIPSRISDNQLLMRNDPLYVLRLRQTGSEQLVKAWLEGNWDIVDGAFFDEFSETRHVIDTKAFEALLNPNMLIYRAFDWGSARPFSCGWYAYLDKDYKIGDKLLPAKALVKFKEWYGASGINKGLKMTADLVAKGILEREKTIPVRVLWGTADPSIFIRDGGPSIAEAMQVIGVTWRKADNKRKVGWERLRQLLTGDGEPKLFFTDACADTIRTLPTLQHDDTDVEDIDTEAEDHAADETRYAVMARAWLPVKAEEAGEFFVHNPVTKTINELIEAQRRKRLAAES